MDDDESSDDAFDPSPLPIKRRRLSVQIPALNGNNGSTPTAQPGKGTRLPTRSNESTPAKKRQQKPKHLVHVHADESDLEDTFHTQLPDLDSSPWRVRGARWKKSQQPIQDKRVQLSPTEAKQLERQNGSLDPVDQAVLGDTDSQISNTETNQLLRDPTKAPIPAEPTKPSVADFDMEKELADLPSDAFASSSPSSPGSPVQAVNRSLTASRPNTSVQNQAQNSLAPKKNYQQMTLFGDATKSHSSNSQSNKTHNWPLMSRDEAPTHHKLNKETLKTYIYPTNLGMVRDYQFSIVKRGLYHNLLVALPTGLGKTFIAATIMLNWYRWTEDAQIVFVAPTKPLVAQQVEACFRIAGIPRSHTTMLTGGIPPGLRNEEWASKRVFFMTPQTIINDLKTGICDPKRIVLLVVDEAHRATGSYAYVEVIKFIRRFNQSFRVLALTATPGNSVETVQEVIDGLDISRVEIRTEFSIDIRQYVHNRNVEQMLFDNTEELEMVMDLFSKSLQPVLNKLRSFNAFWSADPMQLTPYGLTQSRQRWFASPAGKNANAGVKGMIHRMFAVLASLAHNIDLLKYHGIGPFYHNMVAFQKNIDSTAGNKYEKEIAESQSFKEMMRKVGIWVKHDEFIGHPKLEYLQGVILDHFVAAGEGEGVSNGEPPSSTRIMIFVHFRDSAEEVVRVLKRHEPMIRTHVFVGQAASKGSEGMDQKRQLEVIQQFKAGTFNVLVATSIGEEGLDIGEIDLIVCYDSSSSPIRMLQRMGRTGRKRAGNIVLLLMRGKEEASFAKAKDNYEKMQRMIAEAKRFTFHDERSKRIIPKETEPIVDKRAVEIPEENTQADFLPEPKKRGKAPKRPPKKFHMPDGVRTGFVSASRLDDGAGPDNQSHRHSVPKSRQKRKPTDPVELRPPLQEVLLTESEEKELRSSYQDIQAANEDDVVIGLPDLTAHPSCQNQLAPVKLVGHGLKTKNTVIALKAMRQVSDKTLEILKMHSENIPPQTLNRECRVVASDVSKNPSTAKSNFPARRLGPIPTSRKRKQRDPAPADSPTLNAVEGLSSSPAPTDPRLKIHSTGISLGSDTSGEDPQDDEPSSELRNFVVDDDDTDNNTDECADTNAHPSSISNPDGKFGAKVRSEDASASSQKDYLSDDIHSSLPNLRAMLQGNTTTASSKVENIAKKRKRRVVEDSSE